MIEATSYDNTPLFQPWRHGTLSLRNRVVMAPMTRRKAEEDGVPTEAMVSYYERRALGEVGLIISEGTAIDGVHAHDTLTVPRFETDEQRAAWKHVVDAVHRAGGAFAPQLWHTGTRGAQPIGPGEGIAPARGDGTVPERPIRAMVKEDFTQILEAYQSAAQAAQQVGCDALEIHGAHGYLLDSFLHPATNPRDDEYGGTVENRMRFPLEVVRIVHDAVGPDFPVIYRFSQWMTEDRSQWKFRKPDDLGVWVQALREAGVSILHVSTLDAVAPGFPETGEKTLAGWSRELSGLPVISVGRVSLNLTMDKAYGEDRDVVTDPDPAIQLVNRGEVDLLAVGRALIANPDWVPKVRSSLWRELTPFHKNLLQELR
jgi:2,4-dienoyl-CoA reductase-like NADH-dependent reductase (Old Yellow Enzyme family)